MERAPAPPIRPPAPVEPVEPVEPVAAGALAGLRVLDLSQWLAGPAAAAILGDFGADVIMIELPPAGGTSDTWARTSPGTVVTNRNKRSLAPHLRSPRGRELFLELVRVRDVVVENFRPGTLERWKLGPEVLLETNPPLVLLRSSRFGQTVSDLGCDLEKVIAALDVVRQPPAHLFKLFRIF
jgi:formyl-CoA transferase